MLFKSDVFMGLDADELEVEADILRNIECSGIYVDINAVYFRGINISSVLTNSEREKLKTDILRQLKEREQVWKDNKTDQQIDESKGS